MCVFVCDFVRERVECGHTHPPTHTRTGTRTRTQTHTLALTLEILRAHTHFFLMFFCMMCMRAHAYE